MKAWMWLVLLLVLVITLFNFDPLGVVVVRLFGEGSRQWAINLIIIAAIIFVIVRGQKKT